MAALKRDKIVFVFAVMAALFSQFYASKNIAYLLLVFMTLFLAMLSAEKEGSAQLSRILLFVFLLIFCVFQVRPSVTFVDLRYVDFIYLLPLPLVVLSAAFFRIDNRVEVYKGIVFVAVFSCLVNIIFHHFGVYPDLLVQEPYAGSRWKGGFDGPNEFAQFYVLMIALALGLKVEKEISGKAFLFSVGVMLWCVWFSYSRGALLSLSGMAFALFFLILSFKSFIKFAAIVSALSSVFGSKIVGLADNFMDVRARATDRDDILSEAFRLFNDSPVWGHGIGGFSEYASVRNVTPHSDYLYFLVSGGLLALMSILSLFAFLLVRSFRRGMYPELLFFLVFSINALTFNNMVRGRLSIVFGLVLFVFLTSHWRGKVYR